jgi:intraflagellar transport protein 74
VGFNAKVNVEKRLVTQQGLEGIKKQKDNSGGRKIIDKYYYVNLLKKRTTDIQNEIINLKTEIENINKDINEYNNLNKTFEILSREVQNLEGELADYNLAGDKYRSSMRAEDIESVYNHIKVNF